MITARIGCAVSAAPAMRRAAQACPNESICSCTRCRASRAPPVAAALQVLAWTGVTSSQVRPAGQGQGPAVDDGHQPVASLDAFKMGHLVSANQGPFEYMNHMIDVYMLLVSCDGKPIVDLGVVGASMRGLMDKVLRRAPQKPFANASRVAAMALQLRPATLAAAASASSPAASAAAALKAGLQLCGNPCCANFSHASEEAMLAAQGDTR